MNVQGNLRALKKYGYDVKQEAQDIKTIIKNIPISAFKVGHKLKTFGCLALPDVELFEGEEFEDMSCIEEDFSNNINNDAHTTVKSDGNTFKYVKLRKQMERILAAESGVPRKKKNTNNGKARHERNKSQLQP